MKNTTAIVLIVGLIITLLSGCAYLYNKEDKKSLGELFNKDTSANSLLDSAKELLDREKGEI